MSAEVQRVVVIGDASREISQSAFQWAMKGLPLKPGDKLMLLGVLHQVINPCTLSLKAGKLLGYKSKVDSSSILNANNNIVKEEVARKKEEYLKSEDLKQISLECQNTEIQFMIEVRAGPSQKIILKAAKNFKATWIILDRQMKRDKKFLMEKLSCGIARVKKNKQIEQLKGQKSKVSSKVPAVNSTTESRSSSGQVTYNEMLPTDTEDEASSKRFSSLQKNEKAKSVAGGHAEPPCYAPRKSAVAKSSSSEQLITTTASTSSLGNTEASSSSFSDTKGSPLYFQDEDTATNTEHETAGELSPRFITGTQDEGQRKAHSEVSLEDSRIPHSKNDHGWMVIHPQDEAFKNSTCSICKNRRPKVGWKRDFTFTELHAATEGFSPKNFLSEGGFGSVYRGELNGLKIAVKQHNSASSQGEKEFKSEVNVLSTARHENLVMLLGSCSDGNHRLLVYEYVCNGSLDQHLSKHTRRPLTWEKRIRIAMGAAKGLLYLHNKGIVHRDMRPNNILVTHDYESLLGDFGLAKTQHEDAEFSSETRLVGTLGYLAPEYAECGKVSIKTDVYSFGVVLLQLITGLKTTDKALGGKSLVGWARPLLKERNYPDLIDHRIVDSHDVHQLFWMVQVAEKCLCKAPDKRWTMHQVVEAFSYMTEGNTVCCTRYFSPARSDSIGSVHESTESRSDERSLTTDLASGKLPPSPSLKATSAGGIKISLVDGQTRAAGVLTTSNGESLDDIVINIRY